MQSNREMVGVTFAGVEFTVVGRYFSAIPALEYWPNGDPGYAETPAEFENVSVIGCELPDGPDSLVECVYIPEVPAEIVTLYARSLAKHYASGIASRDSDAVHAALQHLVNRTLMRERSRWVTLQEHLGNLACEKLAGGR